MHRRIRGSLYWKICLINGAVFLAGTLVLVLSPLSVSSQVVASELIVVGIGLSIMFTTNALLVHRHLAPLDQLSRTLGEIDNLSAGGLPEAGPGPARDIARSVNDLLTRLESEQRASAARVLTAQETERHRIAQELHDEVGQSLTVVLLGLKQLAANAPPELRADLDELRESARTSLDDVRRVARQLRPGVLDELGLISALAALATDFEQHSAARVRRSFAPGLPALSRDGELVVYRVAQEALTNAARHARASNVDLFLTREDRAVVLEVHDDGCGFENTAQGTGLDGMRERAALIDASVSVSSQPGHGTTVRLRVVAGASS